MARVTGLLSRGVVNVQLESTMREYRRRTSVVVDFNVAFSGTTPKLGSFIVMPLMDSRRVSTPHSKVSNELGKAQTNKKQLALH